MIDYGALIGSLTMGQGELRGADFLVHCKEEGGPWLPGYSPDWVVLIMKNGQVFDKICGARGIKRPPLSADKLAYIEAVISGKRKPYFGPTIAEAENRFQPMSGTVEPLALSRETKVYPASAIPHLKSVKP